MVSMTTVVTATERVYEVGDRVVYKVQFNNPGHYKPDDMLPGEVICRYKNGDGFTYRIKLDIRWSDRVSTCGEPIIAGNINAGRIFPEAGT
jgi:hypothetical protein